MDKKTTKRLAYQAIDENINDSTARQIVRYVFECEIWGQDTVSPTNEYLAKKYKWGIGTTKVAIALAKKSQFITTTGRGKTRCLELNVSFLKGKMAEVQQKKPIKKNLLEDIANDLGIGEPNDLPNKEPNDLPNYLPNNLPNKKDDENTSSKQQTSTFNSDNNNSSNNNSNNNNKYIATLRVAWKDIKSIMDIFYKINPTLNWKNKTTLKATAEMIKKFGLEGTIKMAEAVISIQGKPYAPVATTPYQMKEKLAQFKIYFDRQRNKVKGGVAVK